MKGSSTAYVETKILPIKMGPRDFCMGTNRRKAFQFILPDKIYIEYKATIQQRVGDN